MNDKETLEVLEEEIRRKDKIIEQLREENTVLMRASVKSAEERLILKDKLRELEESD